jgi:sigma-B regulation protein RsbU (phosphoserine phosphatase)
VRHRNEDTESRGAGQRWDEQLGLLASVSQSFASSLDIEETLQNAVAQIIHYMHAEGASLFLLEGEKRDLVCRACAGPVQLLGLRLEAEQGIVGKTVRENRIQFIRDVREDPDFAGFVDRETGFTTRSILCAPLAVKGTCIGALEVINRDSNDGLFDASDRHMLQVLASSASLVIHNARMAAALLEQERMRKELELAREIQSRLLPAPRPPPFPVAGINISAREVSGDFFDYFELSDGRILFDLGDVSGKGMNAALLMAKTSSLLHCLGKTLTDPAELMVRVNREICESATRGMFVTLIVGVYDPSRGTLCFANAGHQPPLHCDCQGRYREIQGAAPPLGVLPNLFYENVEMNLGEGTLYLYTDGLTEATGSDGAQIRVSGLTALIERWRSLPLQERVERIVASATAGAFRSRDDVTMVVIEGQR